MKHKEKLRPETIALPNGKVPTGAQWEEYLDRKQGRGKPAAKVFSEIKERLKRKFK